MKNSFNIFHGLGFRISMFRLYLEVKCHDFSCSPYSFSIKKTFVYLFYFYFKNRIDTHASDISLLIHIFHQLFYVFNIRMVSL